MNLDADINVAEYMTKLPKHELLEQKLHKAVEAARKRLEVKAEKKETRVRFDIDRIFQHQRISSIMRIFWTYPSENLHAKVYISRFEEGELDFGKIN